MVDHAHVMERKREAGGREGQHYEGRRHQPESKPNANRQHQARVHQHPAGRNEHQYRDGLHRHAEPKQRFNDQRKREIEAPGPGQPTAFGGVDKGVELIKRRPVGHRMENAAGVVEGIVVARHKLPVGEREREQIHGADEGQPAGEGP